MENINYLIVIAALIAAVIFIVWLVRRNMKDEKGYENNELNLKSNPEEHRKND